MPRRPEPTFRVKTIIWDVAAKAGKGNLQAIQRELDYELEKLRGEGEISEDTPDIRTIRRIIEKDINNLDPGVVVSKLPEHVWGLRNDYETLKQLAEGHPFATEARGQHLREIRNLLEVWKQELKWATTNLPTSGRYQAQDDKLFPYILQHCPSLGAKYQCAKQIKDRWLTFAEISRVLYEDCDEVFYDIASSRVFKHIYGEFWREDDEDTYDRFRDAFVSSIESRLLGEFTKQQHCSPEDLLNQYPGRHGTEINGKIIAEMKETWQRVQHGLLQHYAIKRTKAADILKGMRKYIRDLREAENALKDAIDTSLVSHEYQRHRCDWCP